MFYRYLSPKVVFFILDYYVKIRIRNLLAEVQLISIFLKTPIPMAYDG